MLIWGIRTWHCQSKSEIVKWFISVSIQASLFLTLIFYLLSVKSFRTTLPKLIKNKVAFNKKSFTKIVAIWNYFDISFVLFLP